MLGVVILLPSGVIWGLLVVARVPRFDRRCTVLYLNLNCFWRKICVPMCDNNCPIMCWNVRGLNSPTRRTAVSEVVGAQRSAILCLQETKIDTWSREIAREVGGARLQDCVVLPALGTRGAAAIF